MSYKADAGRWTAAAAVVFLCAALAGVRHVGAMMTHHHDFHIKEVAFTRLCKTKTILTVNGEFPGPTIYAKKGDTAVVDVYNESGYNITIHWHGVKQPRNPWMDGPEYITQCSIKPGTKFTYRVSFTEEEGTLWWHAHVGFHRATVHGAIVVHPADGATAGYPYPKPHKDVPIILGEWWNANISRVLEEALASGGDVNISDANTINGQPGDLFPCSAGATFRLAVEHGKTYLLRIINAGLSNEMFFAVAGHRLTVVGTDGGYLKPFDVEYIMIVPGQTIDALLHADAPVNANNRRYYIVARPYNTNSAIPFDNTTATAILDYGERSPPAHAPEFPAGLPNFNDTASATAFTGKLRSLANASVPQTVDEPLFVTVSINYLPCPAGRTMPCQGPSNGLLASSLNNVSFSIPHVAVLNAYYRSISGVYTADFPDKPPRFFNFTANGSIPLTMVVTRRATKVKVVEYNASVEVVFQGTALLGAESHPMHLHGFNFFVVGTGVGNFDKEKDPQSYNLVDPPHQNTVGVPASGWAAIRFRACNPGVWFMHCHFDRHLEWGMDTVFIVKDGKETEARMLPPPPDMPPC